MQTITKDLRIAKGQYPGIGKYGVHKSINEKETIQNRIIKKFNSFIKV